MIANFRGVCGESITIQLPYESNVSIACHILTQKLNIEGYEIFIVSLNENQNFYQNDDSMLDVLKENPDFVTFTKHIKYTQDEQSDTKMEKPSNYFFNTLSCMQCSPINHFLYQQYFHILRTVPSDFQDRINQIAEFGFLIEDIKESLRMTNYNVQMAINLIISKNDQKQNHQNNLFASHSFGFSSQQIFIQKNPQYSTQKQNNKIDQQKRTHQTNNWNFERLSESQFQNHQQKEQNSSFSFSQSTQQNWGNPSQFNFQFSKQQSNQDELISNLNPSNSLQQNWNWKKSSKISFPSQQTQQKWSWGKQTGFTFNQQSNVNLQKKQTTPICWNWGGNTESSFHFNQS